MLLTERFGDYVPSLFNEWMNMNSVANMQPKMNIIEKVNEFELEFCVPGLTKDDLSLAIDAEGDLVVEMKKENKAEKPDEKRHYLRHEFSGSQFRQTFELPESIHKESISARVENGVLSIVLPKVTDEEKHRLIR